MPRRKSLAEITEIIRRLKKGQGIRVIHRELKVHRTIVRKVKSIAEQKGWLDLDKNIPPDDEIYSLWESDESKNESEHPLDRFKPDFERWRQENYSYVVIHELIKARYNCSESTVRRYIQKMLPKHAKPVIPRSTMPGEIMEVDFGFLGLAYDDNEKRNRKAYVFSGRLRHSKKAYREVVFNQKQQTFFQCHIHAFEYFSGVPEKVVPDNLKAAVIKASFEDPVINRVYRSLAEYYDFLISPTLPYHPQHKGGVESDIKYIKNNFWPIFKEQGRNKGREIPLAREIQFELDKWTEKTDNRIIKKIGSSPEIIFEEEEKAKLKSLPPFRWDMESWNTCKVDRDWRIQFEKAFYTVPYRYIGQEVIAYGNSQHVRIFLESKEITNHLRAQRPWQVMSKKEHAPANYDHYLSSDRASLIQKAQKIGDFTALLIKKIFETKGIDMLRPARAILFNLSRKYPFHRLEAACKRAIHYNTPSYISVKNILTKGLDKLPLYEDEQTQAGQTTFRFAREYGYFDYRDHIFSNKEKNK